MSGAGAAGVAITKLLISMGIKDVILCDSKGIICEGDPRLNASKKEIASYTNKNKITGSLADALKGADIFVGVSAPGIVTQDMVRSMAKDPIVLAMSNPVPEIMPDLAKEAGSGGCGNGQKRLPQPNKQCAGFPGDIQGSA